jgi:hypothetical protein
MSSGASNQAGELVQFTVGGCLFGSGIFLFLNQVIVHSNGMGRSWGRFGGWGAGGGSSFSWGTPGMGLLMIPLAIGVCLLFAGTYQRWGRLLVWGSIAALVVGVLNSVRISFMPATLWQLAVYVVMIASGGGLMFRSLRSYEQAEAPRASPSPDPRDPRSEELELREELAELRRRLDSLQR